MVNSGYHNVIISINSTNVKMRGYGYPGIYLNAHYSSPWLLHWPGNHHGHYSKQDKSSKPHWQEYGISWVRYFVCSKLPATGKHFSFWQLEVASEWLTLNVVAVGLGWDSATRTRTQMITLRGVQNERFTFEIDTEKALVGCTLERWRPLVLSVQRSNLVHSRRHSQPEVSELSEACAALHFHITSKDTDWVSESL